MGAEQVVGGHRNRRRSRPPTDDVQPTRNAGVVVAIVVSIVVDKDRDDDRDNDGAAGRAKGVCSGLASHDRSLPLLSVGQPTGELRRRLLLSVAPARPRAEGSVSPIQRPARTADSPAGR